MSAVKCERIVCLGFSLLLVLCPAAARPGSLWAASDCHGDLYAKRANDLCRAESEAEEERDMVSCLYLEKRAGFMESREYEKYLEKLDGEESSADRANLWKQARDQPVVYYDFLGMEETISIMGAGPAEVCDNRAFGSSSFYMEIPSDWHVGTNGACPLIFSHESDQDPRGKYNPGQKTYTDVFPGVSIHNKNAEAEVAEFVMAGGIDEVFEDALGHPLTEEYTLEQTEAGVCVFRIMRRGIPVADVCVWANIGQVVVWNFEVKVKVKTAEDHGRVYAFQEWESEDFSTPEAVRDYMKSGKADRLLEPVIGESGSWLCSEYATEYHDFMRFEGKCENRRVALYIPITPDGDENWLLLFESFEGTAAAENAYDMQERIMKTFVLQPYYYEVKKGDILSAISKRYTDDPNHYVEIADFKPNRVKNRPMDPDRIYPGQKIRIPLDLLFYKIHYQ